jgi:cytochrome c-type biogenesis protein CcmE
LEPREALIMTTPWKILLTVIVVIGGATFLVYSAVANSSHYKMVDELLAEDLTQWDGKAVQVHGWVQAGSIVERPIGKERDVTFLLQKNGKKIRVFFKGLTPDTFNDTAEVVATGRLVAASTVSARADAMKVPLADAKYVVESTELSAKCPSKYEGAPSNKTKFQ